MRNFYVGYGGVALEMVGTSFASPAVLSAAIQAQEYEGWFSNLWYPIVKKAVLLASTTDANNDGAVIKGTEWTGGSGPSDGQDGAGQPDLSQVKQILDNNRYTYVSVNDASFTSCGTGCREYTISTFTVSSGRRVKAALVWNACSTSQSSAVVDPTDLDLILVQPAWCLMQLRQSTSIFNELEMIDDDCLLSSPSSGTYIAKVRIKGGGTLPLCGSEPSEPLAFAWSTRL